MRGKEIKVLMPEVGDFNEGLESHYVCLQGFQIGLSDTVVGHAVQSLKVFGPL